MRARLHQQTKPHNKKSLKISKIQNIDSQIELTGGFIDEKT
jgi:hypothetical protein